MRFNPQELPFDEEVRDCCSSDIRLVPAGAPDWVTPELIEDTIQTWQPVYRHSLTPEDALEILISVAYLFEGLEQVERGDDETISGSG